MTLDSAHVRHLARLAGIRLSDSEVERLARELSGVLSEIETLREVDVAEEGRAGEDRRTGSEDSALPGEAPELPGSEERTPDPLTRGPSAFAPDWRESFFVVPRPSAFGEEG